MQQNQKKMNKKTVSLWWLSAMVSALLGLCACAPDDEDAASNITVVQKVRVTRHHLLNTLISSGVHFSQQGQTITLSAPNDILFRGQGTALQKDAYALLDPMKNLIDTYQTDQMWVDVYTQAKHHTPYVRARASKRAQVLMKALHQMHLSIPYTASKGHVIHGKRHAFGTGWKSYTTLRFHFLKHV